MPDEQEKLGSSDKQKKTGCLTRINSIIGFLAAVFGIIGGSIVVYQFVSGNTSLHIQISTGSANVVSSSSPTVVPTFVTTATPSSVSSGATSNSQTTQTDPALVFPYTPWIWFWWALPGIIGWIITPLSRQKAKPKGGDFIAVALVLALISIGPGFLTFFLLGNIFRNYTPTFWASIVIASILPLFYMLGIFIPERSNQKQQQSI